MSSTRRLKLSEKIGRQAEGIPTEQSQLDKKIGVSFVPGPLTDTGATTLPDESLTSIVEDKPAGVSFLRSPSIDTGATSLPDESLTPIVEDKTVVEPELAPAGEVNSKSLLSLTPVCLQKSDTILDTMCFMCLDQGHDFHDGSSRTQTIARKESWIDSSIKDKDVSNARKGYLNKIKAQIFNENHIPPKTLNSKDIFGKTEFIKGLVNTTFSGGDGNYGLLVIDDVNYKKLGGREDIQVDPLINIIQTKLSSTIRFYILEQDIYYYIYSTDAESGSKGVTLNDLNNITGVNALFLPFYQRNYNDGMHNLWTFSIKKHIFIIKLISLNISQQSGKLILDNPVFTCKKYTTLNLTVPEYKLEFLQFYNPNKTRGKFIDTFYKYITENPSEFTGQLPIPKNNKYYEDQLSTFFRENKTKITELFLEKLLLGYVNDSSVVNEDSDGVIYQNGKFFLKKDAVTEELLKFIPRGAKYYFAQCGNVDFIRFLSLLFDSQVPFIHNKYNADSNSEKAKSIITNMLLDSNSTLLKSYITYRDNKTIIDNEHFISKQYGFVTDTSIGSNDTRTTADFLIDSFNSLSPNTNCPVTENSEEKENMSETASAIPKTMSPDSLSPKNRRDTINETDSESQSSSQDIVQEVSRQNFNNIENVDEIFNLSINEDMAKQPFVKINLNSTKPKIEFDEIINKYSNNIQLYYDYLPQNNYEGDIQYFNNCWKSDNFYQQQGGSNYPYKFAIVSGSIDSSKLGGQSIPQYHPPEIDLYMPIFQLEGNGNLMGIIVRMTFAKEVLINTINSKSQVVVFCHFVYIDLINSGIKIEQENGVDKRSDYPTKFQELLKFAVEKTEYKGQEDKCIDIQTDLQNKTNLNNRETDIDFIIRFPNGGIKNWYKFFTYTYGPSVQLSIVIPVNNNTLEGLRTECKDYVSSGIVNVAENLYADGESLGKVFTNEEEKLLFIKLFLIRNKYTGDKSRSTDTLFLNQTKYLEGVQISNDENTLYNAQMFGLNSVWSTSSKTIFYLAPYLTKNIPSDDKPPLYRVPITNGAYVTQLCNGLKNNPNFKSVETTDDEGTTSFEVDSPSQVINDFIAEVLNTIDPDILDKIKKANPSLMNEKVGNSFLESWGTAKYNLDEIRNILQEVQERQIIDKLNNLWDEFKANPTTDVNIFVNNIGDSVISYFNDPRNEYNLNKLYANFNTKMDTLRKNSLNLYKNLLILLNTCKENDINLLKLKNTIIYLNKTIPVWINSIIQDLKTTMTYYYCNTIYTALTIFNSYITDIRSVKDVKQLNDEEQYLVCQKYEAYKNIISIIGTPDYIKRERRGKAEYWKENGCSIQDPNSDGIYGKIRDNCTRTTMVLFSKIQKVVISPPAPIPQPNYLEEIDTSKANIETIKNYENKISKVSLDLLNDFRTGKVNGDNILTNYDNEYASNLNNPATFVSDEELSRIERDLGFFGTRPKPSKDLTQRVTPGKVGGERTQELTQLFLKNFPKNGTKLKQSDIVILPALNEKMIKNFHDNSYKCNIGNYLKGFVEIIENINKKYSSLSFENITSCQELIIKISMLNIESINKTFIPNISSNDILTKIISIDNSYSIDEMNSILNTYNNQLDMYKLIQNVSEPNNYTNIELINIFNESISDIEINNLNLPYSKYTLQDMLLKLPVESELSIESEKIEPEQQIITPKKNIQPQIDYTKLVDEPSMIGRRQLESEQPNYSMGLAYGGISLKNRKKNKNLKTIKNKVKSRKQTIKRKNKKHKYSRRH